MTTTKLSRRGLLAAAVGARAMAQQSSGSGTQAVSPLATTRDWTGVVPVQYPDPDVIALDPRFRKYMIGNTSMNLNPAVELGGVLGSDGY